SYYAYSQSSYYAYSQSAYTTGVNNYYVATTGSDSNSCTQAAPCATVNHVDSILTLGANGTVVHVAAGVYSGAVTVNKSGTASQRITYISDTKWGAVIRPSNGSIPWTSNGSYVTVQNFEMDGSLANTCCGFDTGGTSANWII